MSIDAYREISKAGELRVQRSVTRALHTILSAMLLIGTYLVGVGGLNSAIAANVPGFERSIFINAREQPVGGFITELFGKLGVPVQVDESIVGSVNGDFRKPAGEIFQDIASSFQLTMYSSFTCRPVLRNKCAGTLKSFS